MSKKKGDRVVVYDIAEFKWYVNAKRKNVNINKCTYLSPLRVILEPGDKPELVANYLDSSLKRNACVFGWGEFNNDN